MLEPDSLCLSFYGWPNAETFLGTWKQTGFRPVSHIILILDRWGFGRFSHARSTKKRISWQKGHPLKPAEAISDVFHWEHITPLLHPNQKPLGAISKLIDTFAPQAASVLDPFCGSGTTLIAARGLGNRAVGIEIEERFYELAALRLSQQILDFDPRRVAPQQLSVVPDGSER